LRDQLKEKNKLRKVKKKKRIGVQSRKKMKWYKNKIKSNWNRWNWKKLSKKDSKIKKY
jgi:hypothetical protein